MITAACLVGLIAAVILRSEPSSRGHRGHTYTLIARHGYVVHLHHPWSLDVVSCRVVPFPWSSNEEKKKRTPAGPVGPWSSTGVWRPPTTMLVL